MLTCVRVSKFSITNGLEYVPAMAFGHRNGILHTRESRGVVPRKYENLMALFFQVKGNIITARGSQTVLLVGHAAENAEHKQIVGGKWRLVEFDCL